MKIKALLATLIGAVAINGATAGEWCPPAPDKCPTECCPELAGSLSLGYDTDYVWRGVRFSRDMIWADVNYTFDIACLPVSPVIGVWHGTDLASAPNQYGDETDIYLGVALPEMMGVSADLLYTHYFFPTARTPGGNNNGGDSFGSIALNLQKELFCGLYAGAGSEYFLGGGPTAGVDMSAWYHYAEVGYGKDITDCIAFELTAGVSYSDGLMEGLGLASNQTGRGPGSGWNNYYIKAGVPITIGCNATLTPYVAYNGTPDGWVAGNVNSPTVHAGTNSQDVFYGGISLNVGF